MQVSFRGTNVKVVEGVRDYATEKVTHVGRFFDGLLTADIEFHEQKTPRVADRECIDVTMTTTTGVLIRAGAHAPDFYAAVDMVVDRLETQVRRLKERLVDRAHPRDVRNGGIHSGPPSDDDDEDAGRSPRFVRSKRFDIKPMTAEEAALQMDLLGHGFYFFMNSDSDEPNVVYRRRDGDYGLIEPNR